MSKKLYFSNNDPEFCLTLQYFKKYMIENEVDKMLLTLAKRETNAGHFYCKMHDVIGTVGECGVICEQYCPNNGKNGRCKHYGYCYEMTDKKMQINLSRLKPSRFQYTAPEIMGNSLN